MPLAKNGETTQVNKIRISIFSLCLASISGCVGIFPVEPLIKEESPSLSDPSTRFINGEWNPNPRDFTPEEKWGVPDVIKSCEDLSCSEIWTYDLGMGWSGNWLMAIVIPIPLILPEGRQKRVITFKDGKVINVTSHTSSINFEKASYFPHYIRGPIY